MFREEAKTLPLRILSYFFLVLCFKRTKMHTEGGVGYGSKNLVLQMQSNTKIGTPPLDFLATLITPLKELAQNLKDPLWISSSKSVLCIYDCIQKKSTLNGEKWDLLLKFKVFGSFFYFYFTTNLENQW
jgi:hypothetical protein